MSGNMGLDLTDFSLKVLSLNKLKILIDTLEFQEYLF